MNGLDGPFTTGQRRYALESPQLPNVLQDDLPCSINSLVYHHASKSSQSLCPRESTGPKPVRVTGENINNRGREGTHDEGIAHVSRQPGSSGDY